MYRVEVIPADGRTAGCLNQVAAEGWQLVHAHQVPVRSLTNVEPEDGLFCIFARVQQQAPIMNGFLTTEVHTLSGVNHDESLAGLN